MNVTRMSDCHPDRKHHAKGFCLPCYSQTHERKTAKKAFNQTPKSKAYKKAYNQTPEHKAYMKAYNKAYYKARNEQAQQEDATD